MLASLSGLKKDIAASLYMKPATMNELFKRDFLQNRSEYGVSILLDIMVKDGWLFERGETFHTYKEFALSSEMSEYELD